MVDYNSFIDSYKSKLKDIAEQKILSPFYDNTLAEYEASELKDHIASNAYPHFAVLSSYEFFLGCKRSNFLRKQTHKDYYKNNQATTQGRLDNLEKIKEDLVNRRIV
jgi:hypothetical protein